MEDIKYAGFWCRVAASLLDTLFLSLIIFPILGAVYGQTYFTDPETTTGILDIFLNYIFPFAVVMIFWIYKSATPGKMIMGIKIVNAETGEPLTPVKLFLRYICYYVSMIPICLGFFWVGFDKRKQGFHDKLSGSAVIYSQAKE
jgi:uncharacterized RDD family membrane protein YckC